MQDETEEIKKDQEGAEVAANPEASTDEMADEAKADAAEAEAAA
jgi:hypothetical protein